MSRYLGILSLSVLFVFLVSGPISAQDGRVQHLQAEIQRHRQAIQDLKNQLKSIAPEIQNQNQVSDDTVESSFTPQGSPQGPVPKALEMKAKHDAIKHHKFTEHQDQAQDAHKKKIHHDKAIKNKIIHHDNVAKDHKIKHTKVVKHRQAVQNRNRNDNQGRRVGPGDGPGRRVGPNN